MTAADMIRAGIEVLKTKDWTQGCLARDQNQNAVPVNSPSACSFCMAGAIMLGSGIYVFDRRKMPVEWIEVEQAICGSQSWGIGVLNDYRIKSKEEAIAILEEALTRLGGDPV
jgi:hypothetical protein